MSIPRMVMFLRMDSRQIASLRTLLELLFIIVFFLPMVPPLYAQDWVALHGLTSSEFQQEFNNLVGQGYRLKDLSGYAVDNSARYAAIWDKTTGSAWEARHGLTSSEYQQEFNNLVGQGYRLTRINGYEVGGIVYFAAIWENKLGPAWEARYGLTSSEYQQEFNNLIGQGYRLIWVSGYSQGTEARYAAIWDKTTGSAWEARHGLTSPEYQQEFNNLVIEDYRLTCVSGYTVSGQDYYAAIWEQTDGPGWVARHGILAADYQVVFDQIVSQGYVPVQVDGYSGDGSGRFAATWVLPGTSCWLAGGLDGDCDVDGSDLALLVANTDLWDLSVFAVNFGKLANSQ